MSRRPSVPAPLKRLIQQLFPACVRCGTEANLQVAHVGDRSVVAEALGAHDLPRQERDAWNAAAWNHPANLTRLCRPCEEAYNRLEFTTDELSTLRSAAERVADPRPYAAFFRREALSAAPDHVGDVWSTLYALDQMARATERGDPRADWPRVFLLLGGRAHGTFHLHIDLDEVSMKACTRDPAECRTNTEPWRHWE